MFTVSSVLELVVVVLRYDIGKGVSHMSLTGHLDTPGSPIKAFLYDRFPATKAITGPASTALRATGCACPPPAMDYYPLRKVGLAIDYRIRYFYPATASSEFVAWKGAQGLMKGRTLDYSRLDPDTVVEVGGAVVRDFFVQLDACIASLQPAGRLLALPDEDLLARYCYVLGLFEMFYRSTHTADPIGVPAGRQNVEALLASVPEGIVRDLVALAALFFDRFHDLLQKPVILNPTFAGSEDVGGADADLIIDGTLYELKTTKNNKLEPAWLRQLVGYLLLDYNDELRIRGLGFYFVRHGQIMTWSVEELLSTLSGEATPPDLPTLRSEFHEICSLEASRMSSVPPHTMVKTALP